MAVHASPTRTPFLASPADDGKPPGASEILLVFVAVICVMVVTVAAVALVNRWWVLIPAFLVAVASELAVFGTIRHLLADDE